MEYQRLCSDLSEKDKNTIISKLNEAGFEFNPFKGKGTYHDIIHRKLTEFGDSPVGHINIKGPAGKDYPPIIYIGKNEEGYYFDRINSDVEFPKEYNFKLIEICGSV